MATHGMGFYPFPGHAQMCLSIEKMLVDPVPNEFTLPLSDPCHGLHYHNARAFPLLATA